MSRNKKNDEIKKEKKAQNPKTESSSEHSYTESSSTAEARVNLTKITRTHPKTSRSLNDSSNSTKKLRKFARKQEYNSYPSDSSESGSSSSPIIKKTYYKKYIPIVEQKEILENTIDLIDKNKIEVHFKYPKEDTVAKAKIIYKEDELNLSQTDKSNIVLFMINNMICQTLEESPEDLTSLNIHENKWTEFEQALPEENKGKLPYLKNLYTHLQTNLQPPNHSSSQSR
jgi:hypothetical protein